jgi:hypothetical protein
MRCRVRTMEKKQSSLADDISAALQRACREGDMQVAEHLLRALETMASREEAEASARQAYAKLVQAFRQQGNAQSRK